ncbi:hypothetical protein TNCV_4570971 [Trichonephila clavipes]|nr:hypothetical protein TNCV_4570971 [Trichonephila clavipes]
MEALLAVVSMQVFITRVTSSSQSVDNYHGRQGGRSARGATAQRKGTAKPLARSCIYAECLFVMGVLCWTHAVACPLRNDG